VGSSRQSVAASRDSFSRQRYRVGIAVLRLEKTLHQAAHCGRWYGLLQIVSGLDHDKAGIADASRK
jgi:hypothetical protein